MNVVGNSKMKKIIVNTKCGTRSNKMHNVYHPIRQAKKHQVEADISFSVFSFLF